MRRPTAGSPGNRTRAADSLRTTTGPPSRAVASNVPSLINGMRRVSKYSDVTSRNRMGSWRGSGTPVYGLHTLTGSDEDWVSRDYLRVAGTVPAPIWGESSSRRPFCPKSGSRVNLPDEQPALRLPQGIVAPVREGIIGAP